MFRKVAVVVAAAVVVTSVVASAAVWLSPTTTTTAFRAQIGVLPFSATDVTNPKRGQFENLLQPLFPQGNSANSGYPPWPAAFDRGQRYQWKDLQPKDSTHYDFSKIDADMAAAAAAGKRFHLRFMPMCSDGCLSGNSAQSVPSWLRSTPGATTDYSHNGVTYVIPNWDNSAYLTAADNLIAALGARYNKDERLDWYEFSGYGDWSEGHVGFMSSYLNIPGPSGDASLRQLGYYSPYGDQFITTASIINLVNATLKAFPDTQILTDTDNPEIAKQLLRDNPNLVGHRPVGIRGECLGVYPPPQLWATDSESWYEQSHDPIIPVILDRWRTAPVVIEWCTWQPEGATAYFQKGLSDAVNYHVSLLSSTVIGSSKMPPATFDLWARANKYAGYRYSADATVSAGHLIVTWTNYGTAPVYDKWTVTYQIRNSSGAVAATLPTSFSLASLTANEKFTDIFQDPATQTATDEVALPELPVGGYTVWAKIMWNEHKPNASKSVNYAPMNLAQHGRDSSGAYEIGAFRRDPAHLIPWSWKKPWVGLWHSTVGR
jgi:hypothetical protein